MGSGLRSCARPFLSGMMALPRLPKPGDALRSNLSIEPLVLSARADMNAAKERGHDEHGHKQGSDAELRTGH
jgi:hypothetical protein